MFEGLLAQVQPNNEASTSRLRAPIWEQYAREVEEYTFHDHRAGGPFSYHDLSTSIKKFGFAGLTHLNSKHMEACFSHVDKEGTKEQMTLAREIYFNQEGSSSKTHEVAYLLKLAMLLCHHGTQQDQLQEMWLLINPTLEETI